MTGRADAQAVERLAKEAVHVVEDVARAVGKRIDEAAADVARTVERAERSNAERVARAHHDLGDHDGRHGAGAASGSGSGSGGGTGGGAGGGGSSGGSSSPGGADETPKPPLYGPSREKLADLFANGRVPTARELERWAEDQGWTAVKKEGSPPTYVDENGVKRMVIKLGSARTPGSETPHVALRNADGVRVDPYGNEVSRRSTGNHNDIIWDF